MSEVNSGDSSGTVESAAPAEAIEAVEGQEQTTEGQPAQTQAMKRKYKLKVDGEDVEEEIDLNDEEGMKKRLQLSRAATKRMEEAKADKKKAYELMQAFDKDPETLLKRLGPKGREIAEKFLLAQIQDDMMTPEEKERRTEKAELEKYRMTEKERTEKAQAEVQAKKEYEYAQSFQQTIISALDKSGLPKTPELIKRMAGVMAKNLEYGLELSPDDLAQEVKGDFLSNLKSILADADGDQLIAMFGEDVANKIRRSDIKKLQEKHSGFRVEGKRSENAATPTKRGPMSMDEWREEVARRIKD